MTELLIRPEEITDAINPFPDGSTVQIKDKKVRQSWKVRNDGVVIQLSNNDPQADETWMGNSIRRLVHEAPAASNLFGYQKNGSDKLVTMSTVATAIASQPLLLAGIKTADIYPYQTSAHETLPKGNTPYELFLSLLYQDEKKRRIAISSQPHTYAHDMLGHWLGNAAQEPTSFAVSQKLYDARGEIAEEFGEDALQAYLISLAEGQDRTSGAIINSISDPDRSPETHPYLLGKMMRKIVARCGESHPGIVEQSRRIIDTSGFGIPYAVTTDRGIEYRVPGELEIGPVHYRKVNEALHQSPLALPKLN